MAKKHKKNQKNQSKKNKKPAPSGMPKLTDKKESDAILSEMLQKRNASIQAESATRAEKCMNEIFVLLKKHDCELVPQATLVDMPGPDGKIVSALAATVSIRPSPKEVHGN